MKLHRFFAILMMICFVASCFVSCGNLNGGSSDNSGNSGDNGSGTNDNGTNITITETSISIDIASYPHKVEYQLNEDFDATGLQINATIFQKKSDGTESTTIKEISYPDESLTFSVPDFSTYGYKEVIVFYTYNDYSTGVAFLVNVVDPSNSDSPTLLSTTINSISIKTLPAKTEYSLNETFDPTGLEITVDCTEYYSDGFNSTYEKDVSYPNENLTFSGADLSSVGTKTVTVTYTENGSSQTATFEITVKSATISSKINSSSFDYELNADLSVYNGMDMTLFVDTTSVNIATFYTQFATLLDAVKAGSVKVDFADAGKTTIENGLDMDLEQYPEDTSKFKAFFEAITPENATAESLPSISSTFGVAGNLYGTGIDKFFEKYYELGASDKLNGTDVIGSTGYFDALDYLNANGGIAYDANGDYTGNYYNLNVNAALLMNGVSVKNVNIKGELKQELNFASTLTNVRFDVESKGNDFFVGAHGIGLIEFAGDAPSMTPRVYSGRLVLRNANSKVSFQNGFSIDVSGISDENAIHTNINHSRAGFIEVIYPTQETANTSKFTPESIRVGNDLVSGPDYSATNQQWVKAANEDKWIEYGQGAKYPNKDLLSKAKLDEKNNTLLNTILFNNQKVYNS